MCELFGVSAKYVTDVQQTLTTFAEHGGLTGPHKDGWGIAYYQGQQPKIVKAPEQAAGSATLERIQAQAPESSLIISHIRLATHGDVCLQNTQPFSHPLNMQSLVFAHNGHVPKVQEMALELCFPPDGSTDSEVVFSALLQVISTLSALEFDERRLKIETFLRSLSPLGPLNLLFSDGDVLYAFSNKRTQANGEISAPGMYMICRACSAKNALSARTNEISENQQQLVLFASVPLSDEPWLPMQPNKLYVAKDGALIQDRKSAP
jgi:predicted glutamine amidotransferase